MQIFGGTSDAFVEGSFGCFLLTLFSGNEAVKVVNIVSNV